MLIIIDVNAITPYVGIHDIVNNNKYHHCPVTSPNMTGRKKNPRASPTTIIRNIMLNTLVKKFFIIYYFLNFQIYEEFMGKTNL